jgi:hypothetical protein
MAHVFLPRGVVATASDRKRAPRSEVASRMPFFEVMGMSIGIAPSSVVRARSTCTVETRKQVTSAALGISRPADGRCLSCWNEFTECPGHLGYIPTPYYIHPLAIHTVCNLMNLVCHNCQSPLLDLVTVELALGADLLPSSVFGNTLRVLQQGRRPASTPFGGPSRIRLLVDFVRKAGFCQSCQAPVCAAEVVAGHSIGVTVQGHVFALPALYVRYVLACVISDNIYYLCGLDPVLFPPLHFVCDTVTVSPPNTRPSDIEHSRCDNITKSYRALVMLRQKAADPASPAYAELCARIQGIMLKPSRTSTRASVDTSAVPQLPDVQREQGVYDAARAAVPKAALPPRPRVMAGGTQGSAAQTTTSIQERLSGKRGVVRGESQTCRRDLCARQVMTCDNSKSVTEMLISPSIAHNLKRLETVNPLNAARLCALQLRGKISSFSPEWADGVFLPCASRLVYEPRAGDTVVDTRGPSPRLHKVVRDGVLPVPVLKPFHRVRRGSKTLDPLVPATVQMLPIGTRVERSMVDGDWGVRYRNPCIYESSMFAQKYRTLNPAIEADTEPTTETEHTSRRNTSEAIAQRGDFDGDDNTIITNRGFQADAECARLMTPQAVFLSSKDGAACMYPTQDAALGLWALTMHSPSCPPLVLRREVVQDLLLVIGVPVQRLATLEEAWARHMRAAAAAALSPFDVVCQAVVDSLAFKPFPFAHSPIGLFSAILPPDLSYEGAGLVIERGILVRGIAHAGVWSKHLLPFVYHVCGANVAVEVLDRAERLGSLVAEHLGGSISCQSDHTLVREAQATAASCVRTARALAARPCETLHECSLRNYMLHRQLSSVQNCAQKVTEKHILGPLKGLRDVRRFVRALQAVAGVRCTEESLPPCGTDTGVYDYQWCSSAAAALQLGPTDARAWLALCQPLWSVGRKLGPQPDAGQHRDDTDSVCAARFLWRVHPMAMYCDGSRSISIGTVSQMATLVGQVFNENGEMCGRRGTSRADLAPVHAHERSFGYYHPICQPSVHNRVDWVTLSSTVGTRDSGMVRESFTHGLTSRSMHIMATTIRSTMANSGNGTRRAGHLARLLSLYGENFSVTWDGSIRDAGRVLCPRFGSSGLWSTKNTHDRRHGDMPLDPRGLAAFINNRMERINLPREGAAGTGACGTSGPCP